MFHQEASSSSRARPFSLELGYPTGAWAGIEALGDWSQATIKSCLTQGNPKDSDKHGHHQPHPRPITFSAG